MSSSKVRLPDRSPPSRSISRSPRHSLSPHRKRLRREQDHSSKGRTELDRERDQSGRRDNTKSKIRNGNRGVERDVSLERDVRSRNKDREGKDSARERDADRGKLKDRVREGREDLVWEKDTERGRPREWERDSKDTGWGRDTDRGRRKDRDRERIRDREQSSERGKEKDQPIRDKSRDRRRRHSPEKAQRFKSESLSPEKDHRKREQSPGRNIRPSSLHVKYLSPQRKNVSPLQNARNLELNEDSSKPRKQSGPQDEDEDNRGGEMSRLETNDSLAKMKVAEETLRKDKEKPSFEYSGKLAAETNRVRGITLLFTEPPEARSPTVRWRLYVFKDGEPLKDPLYIHRNSCYLFGRERRVADIPTDHPSCSKQHAVIQYRLIEKIDDNGDTSSEVRPYVMDLGSTNGTFLNGERIDPERYYELYEKDVVKFGNSSREYVLLHEHSAA